MTITSATLFNIEEYNTTTESDPYWDEICVLEEFYEDSRTVPSVLEEFDDGDFLQPHTLPEQSFTLPEHTKQWVEDYYVTRCGTRYWYFRYCYYERKIHHIHIPGGNYQSAIAIGRKDMIESAIAQGKSPSEIKNFIRGGFGASGYKL